MAVMKGYDYDEYQVYINLPHKELEKDYRLLEKIIKAGAEALGITYDSSVTEINWVDSYEI